ncbi:MAG: hypothetical protein ACYSWO_00365 [Planctomycetota bacterium]
MSDKETTHNPTVDYMDRLHRWRMAFFGLVILIAGVVIGGASMMILAPEKLMKPPRGPEFGSQRMIPYLRRDLRLSVEQEAKMRPILENHLKKLNEIRMEARSEIEQALAQMNEGISEILTEEQKRIWRRSLERVEREFYRGGPHRGGGPRGPGFRGGRQEHFRGGPGPGPFGPHRQPTGPNAPTDGRRRGSTDD